MTAILRNVAVRAAALAETYDGADPLDLLRAVLSEEPRGGVALVSSFGTESAVLLHITASVDPATPVLFLDTEKLFAETLAYCDALVARLGLSDVRTIRPDPAELAAADPDGTLWRRAPDRCCQIRKVDPLARALAPFAAWINGRKRFHGGERASIRLVEADDGRLKLNPLANWSGDQVERYRVAHGLPAHPLKAAGYPSVGCAPCTGQAGSQEAARAGRWRGSEKTECGIHRGAAIPQGAPPMG